MKQAKSGFLRLGVTNGIGYALKGNLLQGIIVPGSLA